MSTTAAPRRVENRYLFILETSKEMRREAEASKNVVLQLIYSGVVGQMRVGDTFGIWTYDDKLHAGEIAMQTYVPEDRESIVSRTSEFLNNRKFTGAGSLEPVLGPMVKLATNSPNLTVILISDGKHPMVGTPFDAEISALHKKYYDELHDAKLPFVTVLVANKGEFISYAVNSALGPIRVPRIPKPPAPTNAVAKVTAPLQTNQVKFGPSIYLKGPIPKTTTTTEVPPPATNSTPASPEPPKGETALATTPESKEVAPTTPPASSVVTTVAPKEPEAAPITTEPVPVVIEPEPEPKPVVQTTVVEQPKIAEQPKPIEQAQPVVPVTPVESHPVVQSKSGETVEKTSTSKEQVSNVATFTIPETSNTVAATAVTAPAPPTEVAPPSPPAAPKATKPAVDKKAPAPEPGIVAQTEPSPHLKIILIAIGALLLLILIVLVLMLRKSKHTHPSLITQSIDKSSP